MLSVLNESIQVYVILAFCIVCLVALFIPLVLEFRKGKKDDDNNKL